MVAPRVVRGGIIGLCLILAAAIAACSPPTQSPRERVLEFVRLIQADSLPDIMPYIDLDSVATYEYADAKYDSLPLPQKKQRLLAGFTGSGEIRANWARAQIVVNEEQFLDDTSASVEVSFIDRSTRIQYYSQFLMKKRVANWIITDFQIN